MKKYWFKRKKYGWGWYPSSWQGWLVTTVYLFAILTFSFTLDESSSTSEVAFTFLLPVAFLTITFIRIAYRTGETPEWRWGSKAGKTWVKLIAFVAIFGALGIYFTGKFQEQSHSNWLPNWNESEKTYFKYPPEFSGMKYVEAVDWPPVLTATKSDYSCNEAGEVIARAGKTEEKTINNKKFCVTQVSEGAAGSVYNQYAYSFEKDDWLATLRFTTREVQCMNYPEEEANTCKDFQENFDLDGLIAEIALTSDIQK